MKMKHWLACVALLVAAISMQAQFTGDVLGAHNLSINGPSPMKGGTLPPCQYCHAPHSGIGKGPLWAQTYSTQTYTMYSSTTSGLDTYKQPVAGSPSSLCLSCHDGTVAINSYGGALNPGSSGVITNSANLTKDQLEKAPKYSSSTDWTTML